VADPEKLQEVLGSLGAGSWVRGTSQLGQAHDGVCVLHTGGRRKVEEEQKRRRWIPSDGRRRWQVDRKGGTSVFQTLGSGPHPTVPFPFTCTMRAWVRAV
jgi:hypothetical protein